MLIPNTSCVARTLMLVCAFSWAGLAAQSTLADCSLFAEGSNANWGHVLTLTTSTDDNSNAAQSFDMNITSLPDGAQYRVYKTTANGSDFFGNAQNLSLGANSATIGGVGFARTVKIQFSDGTTEFDALSINGEAQTDCLAAPESGTAMSDCAAIEAGANANWPAVWTLTTPADDNSSAAQSAEIVVTALPDGGANYRVAKTVANGNWFNGNAQALSVGTNSINVAGVGFDRSVKLQFSSAAIEISSLTLNGEAVSCEPAGPTTHAVTFSVNTDNIEVGGNGMFIGGGFLGGANAVALTDNGDNNWSTTLDLEEGTTGYWAFFNSPGWDGDWNTKENLDGDECGDPNNYNDRLLDPVSAATTLEYCFGECTADCPAPPTTYNVTFRVDLSQYEGDFGGAFVNGSFNGWCGACNPMNDAGDGVWEVTLPLPAGSHMYKFTIDGWNDQESLTGGTPCTVLDGGNVNRDLNVEGDIDLGLVCWNSCDECSEDGPVTHPVTFSVNTDNIEVGDNGMYIGGGFLGDATAHALTDNGDNNWSITLDLNEGTAGNWVFLNSPAHGGDWGAKENLEGEDCADSNNWNDRYLPSVTGPTTLEFCFGECVADCPTPATMYNVTFSVDMSQYEGSFGGAFVNGTFNGWCGACNPLTDNGDGTWSATLSLEAGTIEYKFTLDGWNNQEGFEGGESCTTTIDGFTNRTLTIEGDTDTGTVCWNSCEACSSDIPGCTDSNADNYNDAATVDDGSCANIAGAWQIATMCVGWDQPNICGWWSFTAPGGRDCFEDDIYYMGADGTFQNILGDGTWLEGWQGQNPEGCGAPVAPHDGSNAATWSHADGSITLNGLGAYLGLPKAYNGGELGGDNTIGPESRTYLVHSLSSSSLEVDIQVGGAWWRFGFARTSIAGCTDSAACNYNPTADTDDGSCGSTDDCGTCHVPYCYNPVTHIPAFGVSAADCSAPNLYISGTGGGMTNLDSPMSPSWNAACSGCMDMDACNYDESATVSDAAACTYPPHANFDCDGNCNNDADGDGICDELEGLIPEAETACGIGTMWDADLGQCVFNVECAGDINLDGAITANDILLMLANFGTWCPGYGPDAE